MTFRIADYLAARQLPPILGRILVRSLIRYRDTLVLGALGRSSGATQSDAWALIECQRFGEGTEDDSYCSYESED